MIIVINTITYLSIFTAFMLSFFCNSLSPATRVYYPLLSTFGLLTTLSVLLVFPPPDRRAFISRYIISIKAMSLHLPALVLRLKCLIWDTVSVGNGAVSALFRFIVVYWGEGMNWTENG